MPQLSLAQVTNTNDSGAGSLRAVLDAAADDTQITFSLPANSTIQVPGSNPLTVDQSGITIDGTGASLTLSGTTAEGDPLDVIFQSDQVGVPTLLEIIDVNQSNGILEIGGELVYQTNVDTTLAVDIQDLGGAAGTLIKTGGGTLFLNGNTAHTGGTTVEAGTIRGSSNGIQGDILNGGSVVFDQPKPGEGEVLVLSGFDGLITDFMSGSGDLQPGSVTKTGEGTLTFGGGQLHRYTGGTTIESGVLVLEAGTSLPTSADADLSIENAGTLRWQLGGNEVLNGELSGTGTLQIEGAGIVSLTAGSFGGQLDFDSSAIVVDRGGVIQGSVDFGTSNGTLGIDSSSTIGANLTGTTGTLVINDGRTVVLTGLNSHPNTQVGLSGSATLQGDPQSLVGAILNQDSSQLLVGGSGAFTAVVSGTGDFSKIGTGSVTVDQDQPYTGATTIAGGSLVLGADLSGTSSITVDSGAILAGSTDSSSAQLNVSGTLAPSSSGAVIGTVAVDDATFMPGSTLHFDFSDTQGDRLTAVTTIAAGNATLELTPLPGDYSTEVDITLMTAGGSITSAPTELPTFAFLDVHSMKSTAQDFIITVQGDLGGLTAFAESPNQRSVAENVQLQIDAVASDPTSPFAEVRDLFFTLDAGSVAAAYDAVGGENLSAFNSAHLSASSRFARTLNRRSRGASWASKRALVGGERQSALRHVFALVPDDGEEAPEPMLGAWMDLWGGLGRIDDGDALEVDHRLAGISVGFDAPVGPLRLGFAAGYGYANLDIDDLEASSYANSAHAALYVGAASELGYLNSAGRFLYARNHSERDVVVSSFSKTAEADFDTLGGGVGFEAGLNLLRLGAFHLQPIASFDWTRLEQGSFDESGAGALSLDVDTDPIDSLQTGVGLRVGASFHVDGGATMHPELRARWLHEFGDVERSVESRFEGGNLATRFALEGAEAPRDALLAGLGWAGSLTQNLVIHLDYDVLFDADRLDHLLSIGAQFAF